MGAESGGPNGQTSNPDTPTPPRVSGLSPRRCPLIRNQSDAGKGGKCLVLSKEQVPTFVLPHVELGFLPCARHYPEW